MNEFCIICVLDVALSGSSYLFLFLLKIGIRVYFLSSECVPNLTGQKRMTLERGRKKIVYGCCYARFFF
jgi:hypothetical protein